MCLLVRKIEMAKWKQNEILEGEDVSADAITNCMKTRGNTLSTWRIADEDQIEDAVLAMISGPLYKHPETIHVVVLSQKALVEAGLQVEANSGRTALAGFVQNHRNIARLTYESLGTLARLIVSAIAEDKVHYYTRGGLVKLLKKAIAAERIAVTDLHEELRPKLC